MTMTDEPLNINYDEEIETRRQYLTNLATKPEWRYESAETSWQIEYFTRKICGCPKFPIEEESEVLPVEVTSEVGGRILNVFASTKIPDPAALIAAEKIIASMYEEFESEDKRMIAFLSVSSLYINWTMSRNDETGTYGFCSNNGSYGFIEAPVAGTETNALICLFERSYREISRRYHDPIAELKLDYSKYAGIMQTHKDIDTEFPCILVSLSETLVTVHLGIVGKYVTICNLCDDVQFQGDEAITKGAIMLTALKTSIEILVNYYQLICLNSRAEPHSLPFLHKVKLYEQTASIKYTKKLKQGADSVVFEARVDDDVSIDHGSKILIKFSKRYSAEVHELLAGSSLAPKLYSINPIQGNDVWKVIVMQFIEGSMNIIQIQKLPVCERSIIMHDIGKAIKLLQDHEMVHGDIRIPNIVVTKTYCNTKVYLIDFDFSGKLGIAKYPENLDLGVFTWVNFEEFPNILTRHDIASFSEYAQDIRMPYKHDSIMEYIDNPSIIK